jgi:hypothetical protein
MAANRIYRLTSAAKLTFRRFGGIALVVGLPSFVLGLCVGFY